MSVVVLLCAGCGKDIRIRKCEWTRKVAENPERKFYCTRRCYAINGGGKYNLGRHLGHGDSSLLVPGNRGDDYSRFRFFMRRIRARKYKSDIDLQFLKELWEAQHGICSFSGLHMVLPKDTKEWENDPWNPWKASLDRVDSKKGYTRDNVRFISLMANLCKGPFRDEDVLKFCCAVTDHHKQ